MERKELIEKMIDALLPWYEVNGRTLPWREDPTPYHVWISEIMLQQTRIETVIPYYRRFLRELPDLRSLSKADPEHLQKLWEGLGYYSRVRNLQEAARQIMTQHDGCFPNSYEGIHSLQGVGDYTAGAIASICFGIPAPAVDGNVLRVLSRITADPRPVTGERIKKEVRTELAECYPTDHAGECTQAIMELGETVCLPNGVPNCGFCPCRSFCRSSGGEWALFPVKTEKKARREDSITVCLLICGDCIGIQKRPEKGLLAGQWEFPNFPGHMSDETVLRQTVLCGCKPEKAVNKGTDRHIFTHVEWNIKCFAVYCGEQSDQFVWVSREKLRDEISLPTAFRKLLKYLPKENG